MERDAIHRAAAERGLTVSGLVREALGAYGVPLIDTSSARRHIDWSRARLEVNADA